jgi:inhibitor of KinA sporulation pathway (predicted exonuclease)
MTQAKKVRLESGIQKAGKDMKLGQLYEKWQKKTNKSVGRAGVMDDMDTDIEEARRENDPSEKAPKKQNPRWMTKEKMEQKKANKTQNQQEMKSRSELKKKKELDLKNKIKNMKKSDRASYVKHMKEKAGVGGKDKGGSKGKSKGKGKGVKY